MDFQKVLDTLQQGLSFPLPNRIAHEKMARFGRKFDFNNDEPPKLAAVMILLYPKEDSTYFTLIQRAGHPLDPHQNQISLPGGSKEPLEDFNQTAIRETFEEIGVPMDSMNVVRPISTVYVGASNFLIHPFIGSVNHAPSFVPQESEVQEILEIPLAHLLEEERIKTTDIKVRDFSLKGVPYFDLAGKIVWGATAMILAEFKEILVQK